MNDLVAQIQRTHTTKDYKLSIRITDGKAAHDSTKDWILALEFRCHNLLQIMREGLFWTTSNVVPEGGYLRDMKDVNATRNGWKRVWELREFADRDESECRWVATATLYGFSVKFLADFRLHTLCRRNVSSAVAHNKNGECVFVYNRLPDGANFNCFVDSLQPSNGSWWFWPMEVVLDYETLSLQDGGKTDRDV